ncbi:MAG: desulfoferrodoxin [Candidatus Coatesbacteria bacterium]|nr:desulfoferrodoxin [Candidatus Coatesbacteria bacterium]
MTEKFQVYKCEICGNIVEMLHAGQGQMICCGQPMVLKIENTVDASKEKHIPVIEVLNDNEVLVKVGSVPHPMEEKHYIEWIEVLTTDDRIIRKYFKPGDVPEAKFCYPDKVKFAKEYCNIHGLWKGEKDAK